MRLFTIARERIEQIVEEHYHFFKALVVGRFLTVEKKRQPVRGQASCIVQMMFSRQQ